MNPLDVAYLILGILVLALLVYIHLDKKHLKDKQR
jgi:hypothetical protein